jgi:TPR repeat protein
VHQLGLNCVARLYQFGMAVPMDRARARVWFERAADQDNPWARWFANWLAKPGNCIGFRSQWEHDKMGVCLEPTGITFNSSRERSTWLRARYNEFETEQLRNWGSGSSSLCQLSGGTGSGSSCYTPAGRSYDPTSGRCSAPPYDC